VPDEGPAWNLRLVGYLGGLSCFSAVTVIGRWMRDGLDRHPGTALITLCVVVGLLLFLGACRATTPGPPSRLLAHSRWLVALGLVPVLWLCVFGVGVIAQYPRDLAKPHHYQNDAITNISCAARLALGGRNPYTDFYLVDCLSQHGLNGRYTTPLQAGEYAGIRSYPYYPHAGDLRRVFDQAKRLHLQRPAEFESFFSYPAGAFVFVAPFIALGWNDLSSYFLLWIVLAYLWIAWWTPRRLWPWLPALALGNVAVWDEVSGGASDTLDVFLILAGWSLWRRPWLSALLMGAAVTARQQGWFVALFYAILVGRVYGPRALAQRVAIMAAVFGAVNLPYFLPAPGAWVDGVFGPLKDPMFPLGAGLVALGRQDLLPLWPRGVYTALELVALAGAALWYARVCRRHPATGLVLALAPLALAYRSLFTYLMPLATFCLWAVVAALPSRRSDHCPDPAAADTEAADAWA